jgi:ribose-phosphate pyrophosphokinase
VAIVSLPESTSQHVIVSAASPLSMAIGGALDTEPTPLVVEHFPDGELHVAVSGSLRGRRIALLQSLAPPIGETLMAMALAADAVRRAGAASIAGIVPYLAYARQDRRRAEGEALGAAVVAALFAACRFDRLLLVDIHTPALEGLFSCPVEHLTAEPLLAQAIAPLAGADGVVVAPDLGAAKLARRHARRLGLPLAIVHKTRLTPREVSTGEVVGEVRNRRPIIVDDMISTGTTVAAAVDALLDRGALPDVVVAATHGVFAPGWQAALASDAVRHVVVTDSVPGVAADAVDARVRRVSLAPLLAEAIRALDLRLPLGGLLTSA